jgi:hypothetical protein
VRVGIFVLLAVLLRLLLLLLVLEMLGVTTQNRWGEAIRHRGRALQPLELAPSNSNRVSAVDVRHTRDNLKNL